LNYTSCLVRHIMGKDPIGDDCWSGSYDNSQPIHFWSAFHCGPVKRAFILWWFYLLKRGTDQTRWCFDGRNRETLTNKNARCSFLTKKWV
jgi:hypothetical protein